MDILTKLKKHKESIDKLQNKLNESSPEELAKTSGEIENELIQITNSFDDIINKLRGHTELPLNHESISSLLIATHKGIHSVGDALITALEGDIERRSKDLNAADHDKLKTLFSFNTKKPEIGKSILNIEDRWHELILRSGSESDRSFVLIAASALEQRTKDIFTHAFLYKNASMRREVLGFGGPLGTFSSRTKMLYCMGLISLQTYEDINSIRGTRNKFAHSFEDLKLNSPEIKKFLDKMSGNRKPELKSTFSDRDWFIETVKTAFDMLNRSVCLCNFQEREDGDLEFVEFLESIYAESNDPLYQAYLEILKLSESDESTV